MVFPGHMYRRILYLLCLLSAPLSLAGQLPYIFRHLKVENGLSNNNVRTILKDSEGFLWIGTDNGLNRYDGYNFKVYLAKANQAHSLAANDIWELQEDAARSEEHTSELQSRI